MTDHNDPTDPESPPPRCPPDPIVARLLGPGHATAEDLQVLFGFVGEPPGPGVCRLYLTLEFNEYVDIPEEDIRDSVQLSSEENPLGGTVVWVERGATLRYSYVHAESFEVQADWLAGGVSRSAPYGAEGGVVPRQLCPSGWYTRCYPCTHHTCVWVAYGVRGPSSSNRPC